MDLGPGVFPSWVSPKAVFAHAGLCPWPGPAAAFRTPLGPWQGSPMPGSGHGSCPVARTKAPPALAQTTQRQGLAEPGWLAGSAPRLASRGLAPPEGLWPGNRQLSPRGSGWDLQNKQGNRRLPHHAPKEGHGLWPCPPTPHSPGLAPHFWVNRREAWWQAGPRSA